MFRQFRPIDEGEYFVVGVDSAAGGGDFVAAQFISKTKIDVPLVYQSKQTMTEFTNKLAEVLEKIHDKTRIKPTVAIERANGGSFEMDRLASMNRSGKFELFKMPNYGRVDAPEAVKYGWDTNTATRPKMLQDLKDAVDHQVLGIYDKQTITEMFSFVVVQTTSSWKAQAESGAHDDLVMSLAVAWQLYQIQPMRKLDQMYTPQKDNKNWRFD